MRDREDNHGENTGAHQVVKLLASTIFVQFGAVFCGLVHYCTFMADGQGVPSIQSLGECEICRMDPARTMTYSRSRGWPGLNVTSRLMFVFLLILIAEGACARRVCAGAVPIRPGGAGWTISTDKIKNRTFIFTVLGLFVIWYAVRRHARLLACSRPPDDSYAALVLWDVTGRDPASTLYVYERWPCRGCAARTLQFVTVPGGLQRPRRADCGAGPVHGRVVHCVHSPLPHRCAVVSVRTAR